jgi:hypothetical protein
MFKKKEKKLGCSYRLDHPRNMSKLITKAVNPW